MPRFSPQAALRAALHGADARERAAAERLIANFCASNPDGQVTLASTIAPVADAGGAEGAEVPTTFGGELAAALVMGPTGPSGLLTSSRCVMSYMRVQYFIHVCDCSKKGKSVWKYVHHSAWFVCDEGRAVGACCCCTGAGTGP